MTQKLVNHADTCLIVRLPVEILTEIFKNLSNTSHSDTLATFQIISKTCRALRAVGQPFLYKCLAIQLWDLRPGRRGWKIIDTLCNRPDLRASVSELHIRTSFGPAITFNSLADTNAGTEGLETGTVLALLIQLAPNLRCLHLFTCLASLRRLEVWLSETQSKPPMQIHREYHHPELQCDANSVTCKSAAFFHHLWTRANHLGPLCSREPSKLCYLRLEQDRSHIEHNREWSLEELSPLLTRWAGSLETLHLGSVITILDPKALVGPPQSTPLTFPNLTELALDLKLPHQKLGEMAQHTQVLAALLKTIGPRLAKVRIHDSLQQSRERFPCPRGVLYLSDVMHLLRPWGDTTLRYLSFTSSSFLRPTVTFTPIPKLPALETLRVGLTAYGRCTYPSSEDVLDHWDGLATCLWGQGSLKRLTLVGSYRSGDTSGDSGTFREYVKNILGLEDTCGLFGYSYCGWDHGPMSAGAEIRATAMGMELDELEVITFESPGVGKVTGVLRGSGDMAEVTTWMGSKVKVRVSNEGLE